MWSSFLWRPAVIKVPLKKGVGARWLFYCVAKLVSLSGRKCIKAPFGSLQPDSHTSGNVCMRCAPFIDSTDYS